MLVLSRKKSEQIQIGENITITVLRVKGTNVQIGIEAPKHVKVLRSELSYEPAPAAVESDRGAPLGAGRFQHDLPGDHYDDRKNVTLADTLVFYG